MAWLYYLNHLTQQHIAERMGVSRSKVSRMLSEARSSGLVEIRVHSPLMLDTDLQDALKGRLGLRECLVLVAPEAGCGSADVIAGLSALGARYLQENVADGSVVGVNWSSTVYHVVSASTCGRRAT